MVTDGTDITIAIGYKVIYIYIYIYIFLDFPSADICLTLGHSKGQYRCFQTVGSTQINFGIRGHVDTGAYAVKY